MKHWSLAFVIALGLLYPSKLFSQVVEDIPNKDTFKFNGLYLDVSMLFLISNEELNKAAEVNVVNSIYGTYIHKKTEFHINFRQNLEWNDDATQDWNHTLVLSSGLLKYRNISKKKLTLRHFYIEPMFIFQNNTERGLERRFQTGALIHPWRYHLERFKLDLGFGLVYDWSTWKVNELSEIESLTDEALKEKILFINSHTELVDNMFQKHSEWRPMAQLKLLYFFNKDNCILNFSTAYQQSLVSPFNKTITDRYPELKKVYPYILSRVQFTTKLYRGLSLNFTFEVDYENNNLAIYKSSWAYSTLLGLSWQYLR